MTAAGVAGTTHGTEPVIVACRPAGAPAVQKIQSCSAAFADGSKPNPYYADGAWRGLGSILSICSTR